MVPGGVWVVTALALVTAAGASASPSDPGPPADPRCRIVATAAGESHGVRYSTKCNFAQISIRVRTGRKMYGFRPRPTLHGPVDPGDEFRCPPFYEPGQLRFAASCEGRAGSGVRVGSYVVTRYIACELSSRVEVTGTADCAAHVACPAIAYSVSKRFEAPGGCGSF